MAGCDLRRFNWSWPEESPERAQRGQEVSSELGLPKALGLALATRGYDRSHASDLEDRSLRVCTEAIGDPDGIDEAARELLTRARKGRIGILCDYDVDGATAQAILVETLRAVLPSGAGDPAVAVPYRNKEGFGPNVRCLNRLSEAGVSVVAVLDCGTSSGKLLDRFHETSQVPTIVVDHHPPLDLAPPASGLVVNPWVSRAPDPGEQGTLCTAGLAWFLARAILREAGLSPAGTARLRKRLTLLAALGTVCDVMPINTPFNRSLVLAGTRILGEQGNTSPGLAALVDIAAIRGKPTADDFGWRIGPRINAGSRMGKSSLAARCLRETKHSTARELAKQLHELNRSRVTVGRKAAEELESSARQEELAAGPVNLHRVNCATPGTIGLVASSLVRRYGWPAITVAEREDGLLAGSGRTALGFDLGAAVSKACQEGILEGGGGHSAACGLTVRPNRLSDLHSFLNERFRDLHSREGRLPEPTHRIDAALAAPIFRATR